MNSELNAAENHIAPDFQRIFELLPGNHLIIQANAPDYTILGVSDELLKTSALKKHELINHNLFEIFSANPLATLSDGPASLKKSLDSVIKSRQPHKLAVVRYDVKDANGEFQERYWSAINKPVLNENGEILYILHSSLEVTDKIKAEQDGHALKGIETNFNLFMQAPVAVCIVHGNDYVVELANESMLLFLGRTKDIIGKRIIESLPEAGIQGLISILDNVRIKGEPYYVSGFPAEIKINGSRELRYFDMVFKPYYPSTAKEDVSSIFCVVHNVTDQVLARKKAELSEQQVRSFVESAPFPIGIYVGKEMRIQFANQSIMDTWGKGNEIIGKTYAEVLPELEDTGIYGQLDSVYTTGIPFKARNQQVDLVVNGKLQPFFFNYDFTPLVDTEGMVYGVMNTAADVTDLNLAHQKIEESEQSLRNIILQAPMAMCIFRGNDFVVEVANNSMFEFWGKKPEEVMNKPLFEGIPEAKNQGYEELMSKVLKTGKPFNASELPVMLPRNGVVQTVFINFTYEPIRELDGSISAIIAMAMDVTEQVMARKKIEESITELQLAVEIADLGTFRVDLVKNKGTYSKRVKEWFGLTEEEMPMEEVFSHVHPDDLSKVTRELQNTFDNEKQSFHDVTYRIINRSSGELKHMRSLGKTFYNEEGIPYLVIGTIQDVTSQMIYQQQLKSSEAELQKRVLERTQALENLNQELKRSNANLEEFAYAASHDMKEPIRKIHFFADRIKNNLDGKLEPEDARYFERLELATKRMSTLIDDLLMYSHISRGTSAEETVDLNQVLSMVLEDLELEIEEKQAQIVSEDLPVIHGHKRQLQQLFQNLIANSLKYSNPQVPPKVELTCEKVKTKEAPVSLQADISIDDYFLIEIKDNGIGFEQEDAERIFNVFTRLHGNTEYRGTGVGLSIVRKVAENHRGQIIAESSPGMGASFKIYLPQ
jgi:PAS domain S-box-containing protein